MDIKEIKQYFRNLKQLALSGGCHKCPFCCTCPDNYPICESIINAKSDKPEPEDPRQLNLFNQ